MGKLLTAGSMLLTVASLAVFVAGLMRALILLGEAAAAEERPNDALIFFAITIIVASLLFVGARRLSQAMRNDI